MNCRLWRLSLEQSVESVTIISSQLHKVKEFLKINVQEEEMRKEINLFSNVSSRLLSSCNVHINSLRVDHFPIRVPLTSPDVLSSQSFVIAFQLPSAFLAV